MTWMAKPLTVKHVKRAGTPRWRISAVTMQGLRTSQQDTFSLAATLPVADPACFVGVFDGHGGNAASDFCRDNALKFLLPKDCSQLPSREEIEQRTLALDAECMKRCSDGSTAVFAFVSQLQDSRESKSSLAGTSDAVGAFEIRLGWCGDSRALLLRADGSFKELSVDHKPKTPSERARIEAAGGWISSDGRIDGTVNMSRGIGDRRLKLQHWRPATQQKLIALPDVVTTNARAGDVLLMATDGLFDDLKNEVVNERFREFLARTPTDPALALCALMDVALTKGADDNITCVAVQLLGESVSNASASSSSGPQCGCSQCYSIDGEVRSQLVAAAGVARGLAEWSTARFEQQLRSDLERSGVSVAQRVLCLEQCLDKDEAEVAEQLATRQRAAELQQLVKQRREAKHPNINELMSAKLDPETVLDLDLIVHIRYELLEQFEIGLCCRLPVRSGSAPVQLPALIVPTTLHVETGTANKADSKESSATASSDSSAESTGLPLTASEQKKTSSAVSEQATDTPAVLLAVLHDRNGQAQTRLEHARRLMTQSVFAEAHSETSTASEVMSTARSVARFALTKTTASAAVAMIEARPFVRAQAGLVNATPSQSKPQSQPESQDLESEKPLLFEGCGGAVKSGSSFTCEPSEIGAEPFRFNDSNDLLLLLAGKGRATSYLKLAGMVAQTIYSRDLPTAAASACRDVGETSAAALVRLSVPAPARSPSAASSLVGSASVAASSRTKLRTSRLLSIALSVEASKPRAPLTTAETAAVLQFASRLDIDAMLGLRASEQPTDAKDSTCAPFARAHGITALLVLETCREFDIRSLDAQATQAARGDSEAALRGVQRAISETRNRLKNEPEKLVGN